MAGQRDDEEGHTIQSHASLSVVFAPVSGNMAHIHTVRDDLDLTTLVFFVRAPCVKLGKLFVPSSRETLFPSMVVNSFRTETGEKRCTGVLSSGEDV